MKKQLTLISLLGAGSLMAATWTVDSNTTRPADFRTLQEAHDAATVAAGDVLHVISSSITYGDLALTKPLSLIGPGYLLNQNLNFTVAAPSARVGTITFNEGSTGSLVTGLEITGSANFNTSSVTLKRNYVHGQVTLAAGGANASNLQILQNYVAGSISFGGSDSNSGLVIRGNLVMGDLSLFDPGDSGLIEHNVVQNGMSVNAITTNNLCGGSIYGYGTALIRNNWGSGMQLWAGTPTFADNHTWGAEVGFSEQFVGTGSHDAKWQFVAAAAVKGTGLGGVDPGAYAGPDPYVIAGLPAVPLVIGVQAPSSASAASGLSVTVDLQVTP